MNSKSSSTPTPIAIVVRLTLLLFALVSVFTALLIRVVSGNWLQTPAVFLGFLIMATGWVVTVYVLRHKNPQYVVDMLKDSHAEDEPVPGEKTRPRL
jgi:uncharacterized membrane protein (DUF485 family)